MIGQNSLGGLGYFLPEAALNRKDKNWRFHTQQLLVE
jgi:hypothetical protein